MKNNLPSGVIRKGNTTKHGIKTQAKEKSQSRKQNSVCQLGVPPDFLQYFPKNMSLDLVMLQEIYRHPVDVKIYLAIVSV